jgi:tetratricopeptide (TPR) repeat protein
LGLELYYGGDLQRPRRLSDEALAMARRLGDPATLAQVLLARFYAIVNPDTRAERWNNTGELLALTEDLGDSAQRSRALFLRFRVAMESADVAEAARCLEANERLTTELRQPDLCWFVALHRVALALLAGRLQEAERLVHDAQDIGRSAGQPDSAFLTFWQLALIRFEEGRLDEILDEVVRQVRGAPGIPGCEAFLAMAFAELDRRDEARQAFERLAASGFARLPHDGVWVWALTACAAVCAYLDDAPRAALLADLLAAHDDQLGVVVLGTATGSVSHYLGLLATTQHRFDEAEGRFATAEATDERISAPTWLARTRLEWARMLLARRRPGDPDRARELLGEALATARELGLGNVERRAVELLKGQ